MTIRTGCLAAAAPLSNIRGFTLEDSVELKPISSSNTRCADVQKCGKYTWSGTIRAYGCLPQVMPGDRIENVAFYLGPQDCETFGDPGFVYVGGICVESVSLVFNFESSDPVGYEISFKGEGDLICPNIQVPITDLSDLDCPDICGMCIECADSLDGPWTQLYNVTQVNLNFTTTLLPYTNSSTIENGKCLEKNKKGKPSFTLAITRQCDKFEIETCAIKAWRIKCSEGAYITLGFGIVQGHTGLNVDIESESILSYTKNVTFSAFGPNNEQGQIILPDGRIWWP